jgi:hypothetical protein
MSHKGIRAVPLPMLPFRSRQSSRADSLLLTKPGRAVAAAGWTAAAAAGGRKGGRDLDGSVNGTGERRQRCASSPVRRRRADPSFAFMSESSSCPSAPGREGRELLLRMGWGGGGGGGNRPTRG